MRTFYTPTACPLPEGPVLRGAELPVRVGMWGGADVLRYSETTASVQCCSGSLPHSRGLQGDSGSHGPPAGRDHGAQLSAASGPALTQQGLAVRTRSGSELGMKCPLPSQHLCITAPSPLHKSAPGQPTWMTCLLTTRCSRERCPWCVPSCRRRQAPRKVNQGGARGTVESPRLHGYAGEPSGMGGVWGILKCGNQR